MTYEDDEPYYDDRVGSFHGLPVAPFPGEDGASVPDDPSTVAWRLEAPDWDSGPEEVTALWKRFLETVDPASVRALVIGSWGFSEEISSALVVRLLTESADRLTGLRALFLGEISSEEAEISWIQQSDVTPVLAAYPELRELVVRGGSELKFPAVRHEHLRELNLQAGGLPAEVVRGVLGSELPALETLDLWLGVSEYGGDATLADLAPALSGERLPALRHLGLKNSEIQDEIAAAVAAAPVVARLHTLDLSMGTLTDAGAEALLSGQPLSHLRRLNLSHHFLTDTMMEHLTAALAPSGVEVDLSDKEEPDNFDGEVWRFVAISE